MMGEIIGLQPFHHPGGAEAVAKRGHGNGVRNGVRL